MKAILNNLLLISFLVALASCSNDIPNQSEDNKSDQNNPLNSAEVVTNANLYMEKYKNFDGVFTPLPLPSSPRHSIAVYLPKIYETGVKLPIIFIFDPQGLGWYPVRKYKDIAEKRG